MFSLPLEVNVLPHLSHWKEIFPLHIWRCCLRPDFVLNDFAHITHRYLCFSTWETTCCSRWNPCTYVWPQSAHLYGLSTLFGWLCVRCSSRCTSNTSVWLHSVHLKGLPMGTTCLSSWTKPLSSKCSTKCSIMCSSEVNDFPHTLHLGPCLHPLGLIVSATQNLLTEVSSPNLTVKPQPYYQKELPQTALKIQHEK